MNINIHFAQAVHKTSHYVTMLTICIMTILLAQSCASEQNDFIDTNGYISPSVSFDPTMHYRNSGFTITIEDDEIPQSEDISFTLSTQDGRYSHTWESLKNFNAQQTFQTGLYKLTFETPRKLIEKGFANFGAKTDVGIEAGTILDVPVILTPQVARIQCLIPEQYNSGCHVSGLMAHSEGGQYTSVGINETKREGHCYVMPAETRMFVELTDDSGSEIILMTDAIMQLEAAEVADASAVISDRELSVNLGASTWNTGVDESLFTAASPELKPVGFDPSVPFEAVEGIPLQKTFEVKASGARPIKHLYINYSSENGGQYDWTEIDLMDRPGDNPYLSESFLGVEISSDRRSVNVDFTKTIENVATRSSEHSYISLIAVDDRGVCSQPMSFEVITSSVEFNLISSSPAVIGVDKSSITLTTSSPLVETTDFRIITTLAENGKSIECPITDMKLSENNKRITIYFDTPTGARDFDIDVEYMGVKRLSAKISRDNPDFTMSFDTYATSTYVQINAADDKIIRTVTALASFTANGERITVWERYPEKGIVVLSGLKPSTAYEIAARFGALTVASTARTITENAAQLPEADFEDVKTIIDVKHLPSGGRYSSTDLQIVNRQNFTDISVSWPKKYWASVNAKTFCEKATNKNTWYMQPSGEVVYESASGTKSIKISSTGWDLAGQSIPDYIQSPGQYLPYNNNIPTIKHRSTGRLFLGSYTFDPASMQEHYTEGFSFGSRPSSLNGFFKYLPDLDHPSDRGLVLIELYGKDSVGNEIKIADGRGEFRFAVDFTTFNVPLEYTIRGVKAERICVMFASSVTAGDMEQEDKIVPLTARPEKSLMTGSSLWIDNLSLSY